MVRKALTIAAGLVVVASVASAGVPDPRFSTLDPIGVGDNTGTARGGSPVGFDVAVRDVNNAPVLGATVTLNYSASGVKGYVSQNAGTTVNAAAQSLSRVATTGSTNFAAKTGKFTNSATVEVSANGVVLGNAKWRSTDIDGLDGKTALGDFNYFAAKFLAAASAPEVNFDLSVSDVPGLGDFNIFSAEFLAGLAVMTYAW
jgi:hypothetical protein